MSKRISAFLICITLITGIHQRVFSEKYNWDKNKSQQAPHKVMAEACLPATGKTDLSINNVRARINTGGDMWWDLQGNPEYEIPKGSKKTAMFSASLWIAGLDENLQLKCAAQRYRGIGVDFWAGPLTTDGAASITADVCKQYDRHFVITRGEVEQFKAWYEKKEGESKLTDAIKNWPGNGDVSLGQSFFLAPYVSADDSLNAYNPENGDYPYYDFDNALCKSKNPTPEGNGILADQVLKGDQTIWWVFNDKGNIHTETGGSAIGMEIRAQAFAFATNDEINNMTFYSYELINRSTFKLTETYFSQWVDSDIGYAFDDFVGCDVNRGLGYTYNGKDVDGSGQPNAYGAHPPAVGVDFFQGPYMDPDKSDNPSFNGPGLQGPTFNGSCDIVTQSGNEKQMSYGPPNNRKTGNFIVRSEAINGINFGDSIVDNERYGMRRFVYHNNSGGVQGDPAIAIQYYNYLRGIWKDGTKMLYGMNAHISSGAYGPECDFMFPGDSDPCDWGTAGKPPRGEKIWTEEKANNQPYDRRFMQSAGPFTLEPGAVNYITVGVPWARSFTGKPFKSVELLRLVDDKCQRLFDNCFRVINGPDAPSLVIQELNKELVLYLINNKNSNNFNEQYIEIDPEITTPDSLIKKGIKFDSLYRFEGYQIYQLKDATVSISDLSNPDLARIVAQCDIKNFRRTWDATAKAFIDNTSDPITRLINNSFDQSTGFNKAITEVDGLNQGIKHSFDIKLDQFATGDQSLVNNKQYYFIAIAYAYNEYMKYSQDPAQFITPTATQIGTGWEGQKKPYLAGRKSAGGQPISFVVGIPHKNNPEFGGITSNSKYGDVPKITRIEGQGNGGNIVELTKETIDKIMSGPPYKLDEIEYLSGKGPLDIKVVDPLTVVKADYTLKFTNVTEQNGLISDAKWILTNTTTGKTYNSDASININYEQLLLDLGISITIKQVIAPGSNSAQDENGYLNPSKLDSKFKEVEYADSSKMWLTGVPNINQNSVWHWIRSGTLNDVTTPVNNSYEYYYELVNGIQTAKGSGLDDNQYYEKVIGGLWAPYRLCSKYIIQDGNGSNVGYGPAWNDVDNVNKNGVVMSVMDPLNQRANLLSNLASVDLILTSDQSKWTRCAVIETSDDPALAEGNAPKFTLRRHRSVDKNGNTEPTGYGMSWFPGYAINVETGERLNIMFGENSWLVGENGADMLFNPTYYYTTPIGNILWGGMHYVYIMGHNGNTAKDVPSYDEGKFIHDHMPKTLPNNKSGILDSARAIYKDAMWTGIPMAVYGEEWLSNDVTLRFRVSKPYKKYSAANGPGVTNPQNNNYPMYKFSTGDMFIEKNNTEVAKSALDLINVVPNPYYSYSGYESNQLDTKIRITNLPEKCTVTIYSINGGIIRQYKLDKSGISSLKETGDLEYKTSIDWDLKNHAGIPISSGLYLIHVDAPGLGERVIKWFGTMRPTDVNSF